jgi:hypothetical protein
VYVDADESSNTRCMPIRSISAPACPVPGLEEDDDDPDELIRRSFPRPLMPLLLFLYSVAKYSHSPRSCGFMASASVICPNLAVRWRSVEEWNLFWCDYRQLVMSHSKPAEEDLQIPQLAKHLPAVVQQTPERLDILVGGPVGADVAALRKPFVAYVAGEGSFACVAALMGLQSQSVRSLSLSTEQALRSCSHTFRLPSCEKRCPHIGSLQTCQS